MRIHSLSIHNKHLGWGFDNIEFNANLTLLVGASGVGKTQILSAINDLKKIANGESINGFSWKINFSISNDKDFIWEGEYEVIEETDGVFRPASEEKPTFLLEQLLQNGQVIINRDSKNIYFNDNKLPKLSSFESIIHLLKEEESIEIIFNAFQNIVFKEVSNHGRLYTVFQNNTLISALKTKYKTAETLRNSGQDVKIKFFIAYELNLDIFQTIKARFIAIFPQIENIKIQQIDDYKSDVTLRIVCIKEKNVEKWIREDRMSSGMLKTLIHLCEIYLSNDGSVILIDEFENSLGINCMDVLADDLIHENKTLQFIVTSHHPYIINNIPYEYWKIVTRHGGNIMVGDAASYNLGKSKQNAFSQLTKILEKQS